LTLNSCIASLLRPPFQYAYRVTEEKLVPDHKANGVQSTTTKTLTIIKYESNDDGEDGAGIRLSQLLQLRKEMNVLVVVSRWYGGIHLGSKRFAHIVSAAQTVLTQYHQGSKSV
jgi:putative IMPACT (imprinted ancient) family translation regulator